MISREFLELARRRRFAVAAAEVCHEFGLTGITVTTLVRVAGTARGTFYELFSNRTDCLSFAVSDAHETLFATVREVAATGDGEDWPARLEAGVAGLLEAIAAEPPLASLYLIHSYGVAREGPRRGPWEGAEDLEDLIARGSEAAGGRGRQVPAAAEAYWAEVVLAAATTMARRADAEAPPGLAAGLTALITSYFLGDGGPA
jgi:AcrR family transcriptional regulator